MFTNLGKKTVLYIGIFFIYTFPLSAKSNKGYHIPKQISLCNLPEELSLTVLNQNPMLILIENFLTDEQAAEIIDLAKPNMKRSMVGTAGYASQDRTSSTAMFFRSQSPAVNALERKVSQITGYPIDHVEPLQIVWYKKGQEFKPHFDYFASYEMKKYSSQRIITFFVYLNDLDPNAGGETFFPELNIKISPKKNAAIVWYDVDQSGNVDPKTLHGGLPVASGEKWGINIWVHDKPYYISY